MPTRPSSVSGVLLRPTARSAGRAPGTDSLPPHPTLPSPGWPPKRDPRCGSRLPAFRPRLARPPPPHGSPAEAAELILGSLPPAQAHAAHALTHFGKRLETGARRQATRRPQAPHQPWARGPRACREACHHLHKSRGVGEEP